MPLPSDPNMPWPPKAWQPIQEDMREADAWYSGVEAKLINFYGAPEHQATGSHGRIGQGFSKFWARRRADEQTGRQRIHVPAAADVAATSADLLFGDEIALQVPEAHEENAEEAAIAVEDRLSELAELNGLASTLLEGAEVCAGIGGVYLRPVWDRSLAGHPMLDVIHGDHAVPEFRFGRLRAVTFWRVLVTDEKGKVWRHLERHEPPTGDIPAVVLHGLYVGDKDRLGIRRPLQEHPDTAVLVGPDGADDEGIIRLPAGIEGLDVAYVPNMLPNRRHRGMPVGQSDTAAPIDEMDALDETYTSWIRDVRLGKARIIVPNEFLERRGRGKGAVFDMDAEVFSPLEMDPASRDKAEIKLVQPTIRNAEHAQTVLELLERIVTAAGYSPSTFGLIGDQAVVQTATEVTAREARTAATIKRKQRYWRPAIEHVIYNMLVIDREVFGTRVEPMRPRVVWPEPEQDPRRTAESLDLFHRASAMSTEARVRQAQPHLEGEALDAEVQRILGEQGLAVSDPTGGIP